MTANIKMKCESRTELVRQSYKILEMNVLLEQSRIIKNPKKKKKKRKKISLKAVSAFC